MASVVPWSLLRLPPLIQMGLPHAWSLNAILIGLAHQGATASRLCGSPLNCFCNRLESGAMLLQGLRSLEGGYIIELTAGLRGWDTFPPSGS
jgi:hypothetical protein